MTVTEVGYTLTELEALNLYFTNNAIERHWSKLLHLNVTHVNIA